MEPEEITDRVIDHERWYRIFFEELALQICDELEIPASLIFPDDPELEPMYENDSIGGC